ncbi:hypothetical protein ACVBEG_27695 [Pseudomonas sp. GG8]
MKTSPEGWNGIIFRDHRAWVLTNMVPFLDPPLPLTAGEVASIPLTPVQGYEVNKLALQSDFF